MIIIFLMTFWLNNFNIELNEDSTKLFNKTFNQIASILIENMFYSGYFNPKDNKEIFCYVLNNERADLVKYYLDKKEIDYLIENGFDFNKKDKDGYYILDYFKLRNNKYNYPDKYNHIIEYLRSKNFNENKDK